MSSLFENVLASGAVVITDGPFGTQLQEAGLQPGDCPEEWNLSHPDVVRGILAGYRDAGSQAAKTNSFGASRIKLARFGLAGQTAEINRAAAAIARDVSGPDRLVLGCIGPTGEMMEPYGDLTEDEVYEAFLEQSAALAEGGCDALLVETQSILEECCLAIRAGRAAGLPVLASFTFSPTVQGGYASMMGVRPADFAPAAIEAGACVVGTNCSNGPEHMVNVVNEIRAAVPADFPLVAMPNAGLPILQGMKTVFPETPESMAPKCLPFREAGVRFIGGCCGSTPAHIAALRQAFLG
ncbi:MAG: homocysteine S-methyltransferase family protein [Kiritimatiellia bacterium]|jgi:5-methyltetrahydrofolate--homocysteine methyltransferase